MKSSHYFTLFVVLCVCLIGCSGQKYPDGMPKLVPCEIIVQQEGQPLTEAMVSLIPEEGNKWSASGRTDDTGKAVIYTWGKYEGAAEGTYKIVVGKTQTESAPPAASSDEPERRQPEKSYNLVEEIYGETATTPLSIELKKGTKSYTVDAGKAIKKLIQSR